MINCECIIVGTREHKKTDHEMLLEHVIDHLLTYKINISQSVGQHISYSITPVTAQLTTNGENSSILIHRVERERDEK